MALLHRLALAGLLSAVFCFSAYAEVSGLTNGTFRVDESGSATYSIKIEAPPGRAGVTPEVSLNYSSNNNVEGYVGVGWSIGGMQMITRCPQTPVHDNGNINAVTHTSADRFCLNGRRLILVSGTYGAPNSSYRFEVDDLTQVIARGGSTSNGPQYFELTNKAGETLYFGNTSTLTSAFNNPFVARDGFVEPTGHTAGVLAKLWALKAIEDVKGNYIVYNYDKDIVNGTHRLSNIKYAGHRPTSAAPFAEIRFEYADYARGFVGYQAGAPVFRNKRLERVEAYVDNQIYRAFYLEYENPEGVYIEDRTLLTSVQECPALSGSRADCLPATTFTWERPTPGATSLQQQCFTEEGYSYCLNLPTNSTYNPFPTQGNNISGTDNRFTTQVFDMDGDGFSDVIYVRSGRWKIRRGPSFGSEQDLTNVGAGSPENALNIDYDGNGTRDLLVASSATSPWQVIAYESGYGDPQQVLPTNCSVYEPCAPVTITTSANIDSLGRTAIGWSQKAQVMDVNGDGLEDIVFEDGNNLKGYINQGLGDFSTAVTLYQGISGLLKDTEKNTASMKSASAFDINADGRSDLFIEVTTSTDACYRSNGTVIPFISTPAECNDAGGTWVYGQASFTRQLFISSGSTAAPTFSQAFVLVGEVNTVRTADFNGDGLLDVAYVKNNAWYYRLSNGITLLDEHAMTNMSTADNRKNLNQFVDLNGDGRADVLHAVSTSKWDVYFSRPSENRDWAVFEKRGSKTFDNNAAIRFGDLNGDGKLQLLTSTGSSWKTFSKRPGIKEFVVKKITNGHGVDTEISYKSLTDTSVYLFPYSESLQHPDTFSPVYGMHVVSRVQTDSRDTFSGVDQMAVSYAYGGMLIHKKGRGSLGFQMLRTTDEQSGVVTETRYAQEFSTQDYPKTGMPIYSESRLGSQLLSASTNVLDVKNSGFGGYMPYVASSEERAYVLGSNGMSELISVTDTVDDYDAYGNLTLRQQTITEQSTGETWTTTTTNGYGTSSQQRLGRLVSTTVSKTRSGYSGTITRQTNFTYEDGGLGMLSTSTVSPSTSATKVETSYTYDVYGNTVAVSATGYSTATGVNQTRTSSTTYDSRGRYVASRTNALGEQSTFEYNDVAPDFTTGVLLSMTSIDPNGLATTSYYDNLGRIVSTSHPDGRVTSVVRELCATTGCPSANAHYFELTQESGQPDVEMYYDRWGREIVKRTQSFTGGWYSVTTEYDQEGRKFRVYEPNSTIYFSEFAYDSLDRVISDKAPDGSTTQYSYDTFSDEVINSRGQISRLHKNGFGETVNTVDNLGNRVTFLRDAYGNVRRTQTIADGKTSTVTAVYDTWGRRTSTTDPAKGTWNYTYNAFGELHTQRNAKAQTFTLTYDLLGRKIRSYEVSEGTLCWNYGTVGDEGAHAVGLLISAEKFEASDKACPSTLLNTSDYRKSYSYDEFSRVIEVATKIGTQTHRISQTYDSDSRPLVKTFPGGLYADFSARNVYNTYGYLTEVVDDADGSTLRKIDSVNERGQVTEETFGNGVETTRVFEADRGRLETISATFNGNLRHYVDVNYDSLGNVTDRDSRYFSPLGSNARFTEQYLYDGLNRLDHRYVNVQADGVTLPAGYAVNSDYQYDGFGNITFKAGVGYYKYDASKVHRLTGIYQNSNYTGAQYTFSYDANGNVINDGTRSFQYGSFDKATLISNSQASAEMKYGPDRELYSRVETASEGGANVTYTRLYIDDYERVTRYALFSGASEHKYYIGNVIVTRKSFGGKERHYLHKDHQGSVIAISDDDGDIVSQAVYDPFGERHPVYTSDVFDGQFVTEPTEMGYTGHRHIASLGVIDAGGRIYDGKIGRFLQADPFVQFENSSQSYNRYSYVLNNPMSYTDPSGFFLDDLWDSIKEYAAVIVAVALTAFLPGAGTLLGAALIGAISGAVGAAVNGGNILTGALMGAVSAAAFYGVGSYFEGLVGGAGESVFGTGLTGGEFAGKVVMHGITGGVMSIAQGGKFGHGFAAAGITQLFSPGVEFVPSKGGRIFTAAVIGGTASEASGGKFANGAVTGAFSRAFNDEAHQRGRECSGRPCGDRGAESGHRPFGAITDAADNAVDFWIDHDNPVMGTMAMMMTEEYFADTSLTLLPGAGLGRYAARPFFRYVGPNSRAGSPWMTRGRGWSAPYGENYSVAKEALQLPYAPNAVVQVRVPWYQPVIGPRIVSGNPAWGSGGGIEYARGVQWP